MKRGFKLDHTECAEIYHRFLITFDSTNDNIFSDVLSAFRLHNSDILFSHDHYGNNFLHTLALRTSGNNVVLFNIINVILESRYKENMPEFLTECANDRNNHKKLPLVLSDSLDILNTILLALAKQQDKLLFQITLKRYATALKSYASNDPGHENLFKQSLSSIVPRLLCQTPSEPRLDFIEILQRYGANLFGWETLLVLIKKVPATTFRDFAERFGLGRLLHAFMHYGIRDGIQAMKNFGYTLKAEDEDKLSPFYYLNNYNVPSTDLVNKAGFTEKDYKEKLQQN